MTPLRRTVALALLPLAALLAWALGDGLARTRRNRHRPGLWLEETT
jgi:hypothetical protein